MNLQNKTGDLPALPTPDRTMWQYGKQINHYTEDQMMAYAKKAQASILEKVNGQQD